MNGKITIETERCKGCGLCVKVCPNNCIEISKQSNKSGLFPAKATDEGCTGCAMCALICPESVITVSREDNIPIQSTKKKNKTKKDVNKKSKT